MRLRQAHAILEAAAALEAVGLGFKLWPIDYDREDLFPEPDDDYLTGWVEITDPDCPDGNARAYSVTFKACPDDHRISATLTSDLGANAPCLRHEEVDVWVEYDASGSVDPYFRGHVGAGLAERTANTRSRSAPPTRIG